VQASLHKLLVYGPGQFFKPHQDTEKQPGMVATLVVVWPSAHIGGTLCVRHAGQEQSFASQQVGATDTLRWCAFYADCRHEVLPVEDGWRVALSFDLVLPKASHPPAAPADPELLRLLAAEFGTEAAPRTTPWVLLLDHEYSEHGLRWAQLKGADRARALALRSAGQALGLQVDLALAELHETWTAEVAYEGRRRGRGEPEPGELIEEQLTLGWWVDAQDGPRSRHAQRIDPADTFSLRDTGPEDLVDEEYEGYMGNYGETLDYWYRRAAVVLQSPQGAWRSRVRGEFDAALAELRKLARRAGTRAGEAGPAPFSLLPKAAIYGALSIDVRSVGGGAALKALAAAIDPTGAVMPTWLIDAAELVDGVQLGAYPSKLGVMAGGLLNDSSLVVVTKDPAAVQGIFKDRLMQMGGVAGGLKLTPTWEDARTLKDGTSAAAFELKPEPVADDGQAREAAAGAMQMLATQAIFGNRGMHGFARAGQGGLVVTYSQRPDVLTRATDAQAGRGATLADDAVVKSMMQWMVAKPDVVGLVGIGQLFKAARQIAGSFGGGADMLPPVPSRAEPIGVALDVRGGRIEGAIVVPTAVLAAMAEYAADRGPAPDGDAGAPADVEPTP